MVIWIIGLSGSGKTTLSNLVYDSLKPQLPNLVRLDGDVLRDVFANDVDHTIEGRRKNAQRLSNLSKMLADQNIHVVAAVLSIFPEWQRWNRQHIKDYIQVHLDVSVDTLKTRDIKNLYKPAFEGKIKNVVGVDIPFPQPEGSDLVINNERNLENLTTFSKQILELDLVQQVLKVNSNA